MTTRLLPICVAILCLTTLAADRPSRFASVDIEIDPKGKPLAAWQIEFAAETGQVTLVGVENGDHPAYIARPPYYDPAALAGNRILLADFTLNPNPPKQKFRAARLMLEIKGDLEPQFVTKLIAAADDQAKPIEAHVTTKSGTGGPPVNTSKKE